MEALPAPVARYLHAALPAQRPVATSVHVAQRGTFLLRPARDGWFPFEARQALGLNPPGFVWEARVRLAPGLRVHVVDSFRDGAGAMRATLLGFRLSDVRGTPDIAQGALLRYLAEAVLLPAALLPENGVVWRPLDDDRARAGLTVGATSVSLDFTFGEDGLVRSVFTPARMRDVGGRGVPTAWQGRWWDYRPCEGTLVPHRGEVEWLLPEGRQVYWRGQVESVAFG